MLSRILSAVIAAIILMAAIFINEALFYILVFIVTMVALFEYFRAVKAAGHKPFMVVGYIVSVIALVGTGIHIFTGFKFEINYISFYIIGTMLLMLTYTLTKPEKYNFVDLSLTLLGIIYV